MTTTAKVEAPPRAELVERSGAARAEQDRFEAFCRQHACPVTADAVALYFVHLVDSRSLSWSALRYRLRLLDVAAALDHQPQPGRDRVLRTFLLGLRRELSDGRAHIRTPLYLEDIDALTQAVDGDHRHQLRDVAFMLLCDATTLPVDGLRRLRWHQVRIRRNEVVLDLPAQQRAKGPRGKVHITASPGPTCPVAALKTLSRYAGPSHGYVFSNRAERPLAMGTAHRLLEGLPARGSIWSEDIAPAGDRVLMPLLEQLTGERPRETRDRALITLGFAACLTAHEARSLRIRDVEVRAEGLVVSVPGRTGMVGVPRAQVSSRCPVTAWTTWRSVLEQCATDVDSRVAFPRVLGLDVTNRPLDGVGLSWQVQRRCEQAGLLGDYSFGSLRIGFLRTAARAGVAEQLILRQAGLRCLNSVLLHVRREQLLSHNVAAMLGL